MSRIAAPVCLMAIVAACSVTVPNSDTITECHSLECPSPEDVFTAVEIFANHAPLIQDDPLVVEWHAVGETFASWEDENGTHKAIALTVDANRVQVSSWRLLAHELMHVRYWRDGGDPDDANHAKAPGPWTLGDDVVTREVGRVLESRFGEGPSGGCRG